MGLFDRKGKDKSAEIEITVEDQDEEPPELRTPAAASVKPRPPAETAAPSARGKAMTPYGIEHVVQLMRSLPLEQNTELVGEVVRRTLESAHVSIDTILADAQRKEDEIHARIEALTKAIEEMQQEIGSRRKHVMDLQAQLTDITKATDLLSAPVKLKGGVPAGEGPKSAK
jgi:hypothetical protein